MGIPIHLDGKGLDRIDQVGLVIALDAAFPRCDQKDVGDFKAPDLGNGAKVSGRPARGGRVDP